MKKVPLPMADKFYQVGTKPIDDAVTDVLREDNGLVVHGGHAINAQLPADLQRHTEDWDIFATKLGKATALKIESILDKRYGGNFFEVKPALHEGTYRIMNRVTGTAVADVTIPDEDIPYRTLADGINYATLDYFAAHIHKTLKDINNKFRWPKDSEALQRIELYQSTDNKRNKPTAKVLRITTKPKPHKRRRTEYDDRMDWGGGMQTWL